MHFALAIFDLDGTLIDSRGDIADAINAALASTGLPAYPNAEIEPMVGDGARQLVERAVAGRLPAENLDEVFRRYRAHYDSQRTLRTRIYPGVALGLARLAEVGIPRFVATNKPGPLARIVVAELGLAPLVDGVLGEGDVPRRKPDPAMLEEAMRRAGVPRERAIYVGDGPTDVRTAEAAGVPLCLVGWGFRKDETANATPAFRAATFDEVIDVVLGQPS